MRQNKRRLCAAVFLLLSTVTLQAKDAKGPGHLLAFQGGLEAMQASVNGTFVYGPYFALTPMLDFDRVGLRAEAAASVLSDRSNQSFVAASFGAYLWFPFTFYSATHGKHTGVAIAVDAFNLEIGCGMETWDTRSRGFQPYAAANLVLKFPSALERFTIGYEALFITNQATNIFKVGLGFSIW